jgi:hypothetical protein
MGPGVKRPVPVQWRHGQCSGFGQKRAARYWLIRQGVTGDPSRKTQTMPDEKRDRPRAKAPSRIGVQPKAAPSGQDGRWMSGFAKNCISWHVTPP